MNIYLGMAIYFMGNFYFGSTINGIIVSGKKMEEVNKQMASELQTYKLVIKERGGILNSPYYLAKAIFDNIDSGIPVVCYK